MPVSYVEVVHGVVDMKCARATGYAMATGLSRRSLPLPLPLVPGLPMSVSCVEVPDVLRYGLFDMECSRATGEATTIVGLSSRSLPLVRLMSPGLLWCLFSWVGVEYVRCPALEGLGSPWKVQHVHLLDEHPIVHLRAVDPLEEVAAHLGV